MPSPLDSALVRLGPDLLPLDDDESPSGDPLAVCDLWVDRVQHRWACTSCGAHGRLRAGALVCDVCGDDGSCFRPAA